VAGSGSSGANPTATASDVAVNGSASTFMRSDAAPATQKTSSSLFGLAKVDGTTIVAVSGVISATGVAVSPTGNSLATEILADTPTAYWKCDDSGSTLADSSGNGYTLTLNGANVVNSSYLIPTDNTLYLRCIGGTTGFANAVTALGTSPPLTGDWTVVAVTLRDVNSGLDSIFSLGLNSSETEANNLQLYCYLTTTKQGMTWESGGGTDQATNSLRDYAFQAFPTMWHWVKDGTANTVSFYRNGKFVEARSYATEPTGGTGSIEARIGYTGSGTTNPFVVGHVAFFNAAKLSAARIWAHAKAAGLAGS
jgi:hypothetical protein